MMGKALFYVVFALSAAIMLIYCMKSERSAAAAFKGMISGGGLLLAVHFLGGYIGLYLPLNFFTAAVSLILGMPGVMIITLAEKFLF
jgi:pro-sigmaK processing inhibitor BofA